MFKTRSGSRFLSSYGVIIDRNDNEITIREHCGIMEKKFPGLFKTYRKCNGDQKTPEFVEIIRKPIVTRIDPEDGGMFLISGNVLQIYHLMKTFQVVDLISELIYNFVSEEIIPQPGHGLRLADRADYNTFTKKHICRKRDGDVYCPISCDNIKVGNTIVTLPCGHQFSARPIRKWLTQNSSCCPNCRADIRGEDYMERMTLSISDYIYRSYYDGLYRLYDELEE